MSGTRLKIMHVPYCYAPDPIGGTEVYVASLARELETLGASSVVAAPAAKDDTYCVDGIRVHRYAVIEPAPDLEELYGAGSREAAERFGRTLDQELPSIVHLHALTRGVSMHHVEQARRRGIPVIFTYHTPTVTCQQGMLLRGGDTGKVCDGVLDVDTCVRCLFQSKGIREPWMRLASLMIPPGCLPRGPLNTARRLSSLMNLHHTRCRQFFDTVHRVVAVCDWVKRLLLDNQVPEHRILLCRQGVMDGDGIPRQPRRLADAPVRLAFFGRIAPEKGLHIILHALRQVPDASVELDIYGVAQGSQPYVLDVKRHAARDRRVRLLPAIAANQVTAVIGNYHMVVAPSLWLETGPLVVLEAYRARVPIMGSRRGGIAELVTDEVNGLLVAAGDVAAWAGAVERVTREAGLIRRLQSGITEPRTMSTVAHEMLDLYEGVLAGRN
ncbi:MAG: glycosyltransferase [Candidatus Xenobia bacterium]